MSQISIIFSLISLLIVNCNNVIAKPQIPGFSGCGGGGLLDYGYFGSNPCPWSGNFPLTNTLYQYPWNNVIYPPNPCCDTDTEVKVTVYYETLCADSDLFFSNQLNPVYEKLGPEFTLHLVPYGKAKVNVSPINGRWTIECHHGDPECFGNKIHTCLIRDSNVSDEKKIQFIVCTMNGWNKDRVAQTIETVNSTVHNCARTGNIDMKSINNCIQIMGDYYMMTNKYETDLISNTVGSTEFFVPTITINDFYKKSEQEESLKDFKKVICSYLGSNKKGCS